MTHDEMSTLIDKATMKFWRRMSAEAPQLLPYLSVDDLKSQAYLEVTKAMDKWDPDSNVPLEFYLARSVSNGLQNYSKKEVYQRKELHSLDIVDLEIHEVVPEIPLDTLMDLEKSLDHEDMRLLECILRGLTLNDIAGHYGISYRQARESKDILLTKVKECL